jgi:hypothetical protein
VNRTPTTASESKPHRARLALCLLAGLFPGSCGSGDQPAADPGLVLEIDGLRISAEELADFEDYFRELDPTMGRNYRIGELLDQFVLPLHLARRAFGEERARARDLATSLAALVGNGGYTELVKRGEVHGGYQPESPFGRNQLPMPVARYAFDERHLFQVSPPIEVPQGFCVIATYKLLQGVSTVQDRVEAYVVLFDTQSTGGFSTWYKAEKQRIGDRVTYVHPDYRDALPPWVKTNQVSQRMKR